MMKSTEVIRELPEKRSQTLINSKINSIMHQIENLLDLATYTENNFITYDKEISSRVKQILTENGYTVSEK